MEYTQYYFTPKSRLSCTIESPNDEIHKNYEINGLNTGNFPYNICKYYFEDYHKEKLDPKAIREHSTLVLELENRVIVHLCIVVYAENRRAYWREKEELHLYSNLNDLFVHHPEIVEQFDQYQLKLAIPN